MVAIPAADLVAIPAADLVAIPAADLVAIPAADLVAIPAADLVAIPGQRSTLLTGARNLSLAHKMDRPLARLAGPSRNLPATKQTTHQHSSSITVMIGQQVLQPGDRVSNFDSPSIAWYSLKDKPHYHTLVVFSPTHPQASKPHRSPYVFMLATNIPNCDIGSGQVIIGWEKPTPNLDGGTYMYVINLYCHDEMITDIPRQRDCYPLHLFDRAGLELERSLNLTQVCPSRIQRRLSGVLNSLTEEELSGRLKKSLSTNK
jgi:hypothetical protein